MGHSAGRCCKGNVAVVPTVVDVRFIDVLVDVEDVEGAAAVVSWMPVGDGFRAEGGIILRHRPGAKELHLFSHTGLPPQSQDLATLLWRCPSSQSLKPIDGISSVGCGTLETV